MKGRNAKEDKDVGEKIRVSSGNITPTSGFISKTFEILPPTVLVEDIKRIVERRLTKKFEEMSVEELLEIQLPEITIDLDEEIAKSYLKTGELGLYLIYLKNRRMMSSGKLQYDHFTVKSRVQPGVSVIGTMTQGQKSAVKMNSENFQITLEIFKNVPSIKNGFDDFTESIFGQPFYITLSKNDFRADLFKNEKTKSKHYDKYSIGNERTSLKASEKDDKNIDDVSENNNNNEEKDRDSGKKKMGSKYKPIVGEMGTEKVETLIDLPDQILLDKLTSDTQTKYWGPFLTVVEALRLQISVIPFYFRSVTIQVPLYFRNGKYYESKPEVKRSRNRKNKYESRKKPLKSGEENDSKSEKVDLFSVLKKQLRSDIYDTAKSFKKIADEVFVNLGVAEGLPMLYENTDAFKYNGMSENLNLTNPYDIAEYVKMNAVKKVYNGVYDDEKQTEHAFTNPMLFDENTEVVFGNVEPEFKNDLEYFTDVMISERSNFLNRINQLLNELKRNWTIPQSDDAIRSKNLEIGTEVEKIEQQINEYTKKWSEKLYELSLKYGRDTVVNVPKVVIPDLLRGVTVNLKEMGKSDETQSYAFVSMFSPNISEIKRQKIEEYSDFEKIYKEEDDDDDGDAYEEEEEENDIELKYIHVTHNIPTIPDLDQGEIYRYFDGSSTKYMWVWSDTAHQGSKTMNDTIKNLEPFMMFIVFNDIDNAGIPQSPLSTLIPLYNEYKDLKGKIATQSKKGNTDLFTISSALPKPEKIESEFFNGKQFTPVFQTGERVKLPNETTINAAAASSGFDSLFLSLSDASQSLKISETSGYGDGSRDILEAKLKEKKRKKKLLYEKYMLAEPYQMLSTPKHVLNSRPSAHDLYVKQHEAKLVSDYSKINEQHIVMSELMTAAIGRQTVFTPCGFFTALMPGEKLEKIEIKNDIDYERLERLEDRLTEEGGILTGYPITNLVTTNKSSASKASYSAYGTKNDNQTVNSVNVGYRVHQENKNPTQELRVSKKEQLLEKYSRIVAELFSLAYDNFFRFEDSWYKKLLKNTFQMESKYDSLPPVASLFDVNVTFPPSSSATVNEILSLYNMGAVGIQDVALTLASNAKKLTGNAPYDFTKIYASRKQHDFQSFEKHILGRLEEMRQLEIDKQKPQIPAASIQNSSKKDKKTASNSNKRKPETKKEKKPSKKQKTSDAGGNGSKSKIKGDTKKIKDEDVSL